MSRSKNSAGGDGDHQLSQFEHRLYCYIYRLVRNHHDAEDILQQVLLVWWQARNLPVRPEFYAYRIAKLRSLDCFRKRGRSLELSGMQSLLDETLEDSSTAFANYESDEIYERVLGAINKLPTDLRKVIQMRYFEKLSYAEIAQRLSISESTARVRCFRALRMLRDWLTDN